MLLCMQDYACCILIHICAFVVIITFLYSITMSHTQVYQIGFQQKIDGTLKRFTEKALLKGLSTKGCRSQQSIMKYESPP